MRGAQYTVKQVADLTGVAPATLRAWERRYGVVEPQRSSSRYRLYDDADVTRLTRMAELVRSGTPASLAAARLRQTQALPDQATSATPDDEAAATGLIDAARTFDERQLTRVLDAGMAGASFETALEGWLMPSLIEVGRAWERGEIDVAGEHFVSAGVNRRLAGAFEAAGPNLGAPVTLVGTPAGSLHELGALAFSVCLRRLGIDVRFLGADVPHASWAHSVATLRPAAVVISVPTTRDTPAVTELLALMEREHPDVRLWLGGNGAVDAPSARVLPTSLVDAASEVALALRAA